MSEVWAGCPKLGHSTLIKLIRIFDFEYLSLIQPYRIIRKYKIIELYTYNLLVLGSHMEQVVSSKIVKPNITLYCI